MATDEFYLELDEETETPELPSDAATRHKRRERWLRRVKWAAILLIVLAIYFSYNQFMLYFISFLTKNPTLYGYYLFIQEQVADKTILGLFAMAIMGSLFFLALPSEALFTYYLSSTSHFFIVIMVVMLLGNLLGLIINYLFGRLLGERVLKILFKKNFRKYQRKIKRWGGYVLFFGNILPGPIELLVVFYGGFRFNFPRYVYLCFMGRLFKYLIILMLYLFFWDQLTQGYELLMKNVLVLKDLYV